MRLWLTNTANTRVFNVTLPGARMKLVGGDSGRVEHEEFVEQVAAGAVGAGRGRRAGRAAGRAGPGAPHPGSDLPARRDHRRPTERASTAAGAEFEALRRAPELEAERQQLDAWLAAPPDKILALVAQMDDPAAMPQAAGPVTYACPMHPEVTSDRARPLPQVRHEAARQPAPR